MWLGWHIKPSTRGDPVQAALLNDQQTHLQTLLDRQDKMCMGTSIESRVPFLDIELVQLANTIPSSYKLRKKTSKAILRAAAGNLLPEQIRIRPKYPFGLPLYHWFAYGSDLNALAQELPSGRLVNEGIIQSRIVSSLLRHVQTGAELHSSLLWNILNLELWWRIFITQDLVPDKKELPAYVLKS